MSRPTDTAHVPDDYRRTPINDGALYVYRCECGAYSVVQAYYRPDGVDALAIRPSKCGADFSAHAATEESDVRAFEGREPSAWDAMTDAADAAHSSEVVA